MFRASEFFSRPRLQVALDVPDLREALKIASEAWRGGVDVIEAGTILIKSTGVKAIKELRKSFPDAALYADLKTLDSGYLEAKLALEVGADIVGISALAGDETIVGAVDAARECGGAICADLIWVKDPLKRFREVARLGCQIACFHVSVDTQRHLGKTAAELANYVKEAVKLGLCVVGVAGGVNVEQAALYARMGVKLIVVGGAIVKADDPCKSAEKIKRAIWSSSA